MEALSLPVHCGWKRSAHEVGYGLNQVTFVSPSPHQARSETDSDDKRGSILEFRQVKITVATQGRT